MTREVVLALDGSAKDARGLAVAAAIAELANADVRLVRVVGEDDAGATRGLHRALAEVADRMGTELARPVSAEVVEAEDVATALVRHAAERRPLLLVMSTRAPGTVARALRGSVADRVMRECPRPVLLVPPGTADVGGRHLRFSRVLVPLDGSALATRSLDYLLRLPRAAGLEYVLLEVVSRADAVPAAMARLEAAAQRVRGAGVAGVEFDVATAGDPAAAIVEAVRDALVDLIAMSSRGASGVRRLVLGSVAEGVLRASDVPALLLTPATLAEE